VQSGGFVETGLNIRGKRKDHKGEVRKRKEITLPMSGQRQFMPNQLIGTLIVRGVLGVSSALMECTYSTGEG